MTLKSEKISYLKRIPPFYIFILAISPIIISFLIHIIGLFFADKLTWQFGEVGDLEETAVATVVLEGQKEDRLKFQGIDPLDSFRTEDKARVSSRQVYSPHFLHLRSQYR